MKKTDDIGVLFDYLYNNTKVYKKCLIHSLKQTTDYVEYFNNRYNRFLVDNDLLEEDNDPDKWEEFICTKK
jgi:hypothetical protein